MYKLIHGDCIQEMNKLDARSIDMVMVDLPYGTTANKWDAIIPFYWMWHQLNRIVKEDGAIVMTSAQPFTTKLIASNIKSFKYTWVWIKNLATGPLNAHKRPMKAHEDIVVFSNGLVPYYPQGLMPLGKVKKNGLGTTNYGDTRGGTRNQEFTNYPRDVLEFKSANGTVHPTQKPIALMEYMIKTYTKEGDMVLDFTMGSGTTICAALNADRFCIGIEMSDEYFEKAKTRIENHNIQRKLF